MKRAFLRLLPLPALLLTLSLSACDNQPTATEADKTATVVENPDVAPVTPDSAATADSITATP